MSEPLASTRLTEGAVDAAAAMLAALRERGAHRADPVRLDIAEALARRAAAHHGEVRRLLDHRLAAWLAECVERPARGAAEGGHEVPAGQGPLADLLSHLAGQAAAQPDGGAAASAPTRGEAPAELKALRHFKSTWSQLSVDRQLSRSMAGVPDNAGPLNSHHLALRSLTAMRDTSPAYLSRFMSYVDALLWLDQAAEGGDPARAKVATGDGDKARKPRRRRAG